MIWETYIYIESKNHSQYNQVTNEVITYLKNNNNISWGYSIEKKGGKIVYTIIICKVNKIFPSKKNTIINRVKGILLLAGIKDILISQKNYKKNYKSYNLTSNKINISAENIVKSLQKINLPNFYILTRTKCVKISDYRTLIRYLDKLIRNKNQYYNPIFIEEKSSKKNTSRYSRRVFGSNYSGKTNMILNLFGSEANRDQRLYEYMLNELQIIDNSTNLSDNDFDNRIKSILKNVQWELYIYEYKINVLIPIKEIDTNFLSSFFDIFQYEITNNARKINVTFSNQIWKILQIPINYKIKILNQQGTLSNYPINAKNIIGYTKSENFKIFPIGLCVQDFTEGGLITGAIGTGKTTLRLKIMKFLLDEKVRVIDFDIKGDAPKYKILCSQGIVLIPGIDFAINPFDCPSNISYKNHSENLYRMFVEIISEGEFTTPQKNLLFKAIYKTTKEKGNARQFFENILLISYQEQLVIDNKQDITAQSLIIKFNWMQFSLGSIFWNKVSSLNLESYKNKSLFFDLSKLNQIATHDQIRFIVDLIMNNVISSVNDFKPSNYKGKPELIIFIDEAQIIMPKNTSRKLTKLEETLSTLRYKGISVIATGISADLMSQILLDTNFVAQFRSETELLSKKLGLDSNRDIISRLSNYECIIKIKSMGISSNHISINDFPYFYDDNSKYNKKYLHETLESFAIDNNSVLKIRIKSIFYPKFILLEQFNKLLELEADLFFKSEILPFTKIQQQSSVSDLVELMNIKYKALENLNVLSQIVKDEPEQFLLHVLYSYYLDLINNLSYYKKNIQTTLISSINKAIQLIKLQYIENNYNVTIDKISDFEILYNRILNDKLVKQRDYIKFIEETKQQLIISINFNVFNNDTIETNISMEEKIGIAYDLNVITYESYLNYLKFIDIFNIEIIAYEKNIKLALIVANEIINNQKSFFAI